MTLPPFEAELWEWSARASWYFVTVPAAISDDLRAASLFTARGWGSVRVEADIEGHRWKTSVFPQKSDGTFVLPVKAEIRRKCGATKGSILKVHLRLLD